MFTFLHTVYSKNRMGAWGCCAMLSLSTSSPNWTTTKHWIPHFCPPSKFQKKISPNNMSCSKSWFPTFTKGERGEETMVINILVSETKLDSSLTVWQIMVKHCNTPFKLDRNQTVVGVYYLTCVMISYVNFGLNSLLKRLLKIFL